MSRIIPEIFRLLSLHGVKYAVCSPGSRNASLLAAADMCGEMKKLVVVDERCAAFIALGIALVSRSPVVLICTSGTALLNYAPALAEALYQGVPLIVLSADRPLEWIDQDDSQTIRQNGALDNVVKKSYSIVERNIDEDYLWYVNRIVNEGLLTALSAKKGPVHFNIHLGNSVNLSASDMEVTARSIEILKPRPVFDKEMINTLAACVAAKRVMVVAGFMQPDNHLQRAMMQFLKLPNICVMAETVSNLHLPEECFRVDTPLFPLSDAERQALAPDIVISMGGALISRKLKEFIRSYPPREHWHIGENDDTIADCFKSLTKKLEVSPASFVRSLAKRLQRIQPASLSNALNYQEQWRHIRERGKKDLKTVDWCDLTALSMVLNAVPAETNLFLSNGTSVRYAQIIPYRLPHASYANRGVSGIEGCTSAALGASLVYGKMTCLVTGDMSFLYDISALNTGLAKPNLRIVVLGNSGGDIFRFIGATKDLAIREKYLCAAQDFPAKELIESLGWHYFEADNKDDLRRMLKHFFKYNGRPTLLYLNTAQSDNSKILTEYLNNNL